ncbi:MAG: carbohydrate ABC transporter permease [Arcanobacterium sp.]|nr:carbohydrate ABC transporter permease [Arcanobacterium sp.]MDY5588594.1 carbohydrate ABC transporter permease [Arcanobacterium sp.]
MTNIDTHVTLATYSQSVEAPVSNPAIPPLSRHKHKKKLNSKSGARRRHHILVYTGLILAAAIAVFPLLFMVSSSLKADDQQIFADLASWRAFFPVGELTLDNYAGVNDRVPAVRFFINSIIVTLAIVLLGLFVNSLIGFAIARIRFRGSKFVLSLVLATLMVPFETIAVPMIYWVSKLPTISWAKDGFLLSQGMLNTYQVQILPFVANALAIFLFVQQFKTIPKEFDEAAKVDGASWFTIYLKIIVPMSKSTFATVAIILMLPAWNSYLWPLMAVQQEDLRPVSVGMQYFFQLNPEWGQIMAYATLITLPMLILFVIFQKAFVTSLASSGVKG